MAVSVVVGGQYGSEGKGKVTSHLVRNRGYDVAVRCGGPNSGHTITAHGDKYILQQIPAGVVDPNTDLYLAAGCLINIDVLLEEISEFDIDPTRLQIDKNAVIIKNEYIKQEKERKLRERIGSTCSGTGIAVAKRVLRSDEVTLAKNVEQLQPYISNIRKTINEDIDAGRDIVVEGTQGFGLSVYHSPHYPNATSRDTTASGFLSEVGISPLNVTDVIMVIRTYPIRVPGNSGPLNNEISWEVVRERSGYPHNVVEYTSVTNRKRRVAEFDFDIVNEASRTNDPTEMALMGTDLLDYENKDVGGFSNLSPDAKQFIRKIEDSTQKKVSLIGTGPTDKELIDRTLGNYGQVASPQLED